MKETELAGTLKSSPSDVVGVALFPPHSIASISTPPNRRARKRLPTLKRLPSGETFVISNECAGHNEAVANKDDCYRAGVRDPRGEIARPGSGSARGREKCAICVGMKLRPAVCVGDIPVPSMGPRFLFCGHLRTLRVSQQELESRGIEILCSRHPSPGNEDLICFELVC